MARKPPELPYGVRLTIAYDGTDFHGWQWQDGYRTVQGEIERGIEAMGLTASRVRGCSRTDAGVHAEGQVISFATKNKLPDDGWIIGLNGVLADDVVVKAAKSCHRLYNPRFDAQKKLYRYLVQVGNTADPMLRRRAWQYGPRLARRDLSEGNPGLSRKERVAVFLDVDAMREAAAHLVGRHDFQAFRAYDDGREHTERTLHRVEIIEGFEGRLDLMAIEIEGDGFMKNMVRILAGTLTDVGRQRIAPAQVQGMIGAEGKRSDGGPTAPAHGLTLVTVWLECGDHKRVEEGRV